MPHTHEIVYSDIQELIDNELMTVKQSASFVGLEYETLRQYLSSRRYPYRILKAGRTPLLRRKDLEAWKQQRES